MQYEKKTLLLVTKRKYIHDTYYAELVKVFGDRINIVPYYHVADDNSPLAHAEITNADIVLLSNVYSFPQARRQMSSGAPIISLKFTFDKAKVDALKRYPVGTQALAVFNYYSSAHEAVNTLYEADVSNLDLYVYYPGNQNLEGKKIDLAIVSGHTDEIPEGIPEIFDLGERRIALNTLLEIALKANILDDEVEASILDYCSHTVNPESYTSHFYDLSSSYNLQLHTIMGYVDYGIVIYDKNMRIADYNKNFIELLGLRDALYGLNLSDLLKDTELAEYIGPESQAVNKLCTLSDQGRMLSVTNRKIDQRLYSGNSYILMIRDVTEITRLETSLRLQIAEIGHIAKYHFDDIKYRSRIMESCLTKAKRIATIDKPTLIVGESGTGKELVAQSIHNASSRAHYPFVAMNCAAIPASLLESELFGYEEGAFTGARKGGKEGLFQLAQRGTLFLDEIGDLDLSTQAKLLRVLEEMEIMPIGSDRLIKIDVRIIAATNRDLESLTKEGKFRLDLYFRLNTLIVHLPPLRERKKDVPVLIDEFLKQEGRGGTKFDPSVWDFLLNYEWKGNVRELRNCITYASNICDGKVKAEHLPDYLFDNYNAYSGSAGLLRLSENPINHLPFPAEELRSVLSLISCGHSGRRSISKDSGITEYRLRHILQFLSSSRYILVNSGRSGCTITREGLEYLDALKSHTETGN